MAEKPKDCPCPANNGMNCGWPHCPRRPASAAEQAAKPFRERSP